MAWSTSECIDVPVSESRQNLPLKFVPVVHRHQVFSGPDDGDKLVGVLASDLACHLDADSPTPHHDDVGGLVDFGREGLKEQAYFLDT